MKPPVPGNPDQINVITGHILLSFVWRSGQSWRTRRATPRAPNCRVGRNDPSPRNVRHYGVVAVPSVARAFIVANSA
jgi:hypothetical protein